MGRTKRFGLQPKNCSRSCVRRDYYIVSASITHRPRTDCPQRVFWLSWWCSGSASDSWSKGHWFNSRLGTIKSTRSTQPFIRLGYVNRVPACMAGVRRGAFTCVGWQVTLCDPIWQVTSRSSEMGFSWRAISAFTLFAFWTVSWNVENVFYWMYTIV